MHYFEEKYPAITDLYYAYVNSDEYSASPVTDCAAAASGKAFKDISALIQGDKIMEVEDLLLSACVEYEHCGFILGFTYALKFFKESGVPVCPT